MKARIIILIICISLLMFLAYKFLGTSSVMTPPTPLPVPASILQRTDATLTYQDIVYDYKFFTVSRLDKLKLLPNFDTPVRGSSLAGKNQCDFAINGGFYSTDNKPLGAFITENYDQSKALTSNLFNGFFEFSKTKSAISKELDASYTSVLQSGPLLIFDMTPLPLAIQNDEHARRTVVAKTTDDRVMFITFYIHDSIYNGPLLTDLPMILKQFTASQHVSITAALNLDGGSATYFKTPDSELPELSSIGSMFCLQK